VPVILNFVVLVELACEVQRKLGAGPLAGCQCGFKCGAPCTFDCLDYFLFAGFVNKRFN